MNLMPVDAIIDILLAHALPEGGFSLHPRGGYRADATAWAALTLAPLDAGGDAVEAARGRLAADQAEDGRVSISREHPQAFWPTPLAVLAWRGSPAHRDPLARALQFLLATEGNHFAKKDNAPAGHDTTIRGWPWIGDTHSWVEPTSLALLALGVVGHGGHARCGEARRLLLDRQLPRGGWNYGNTTVFQQELRPMPESTGLALGALAGKTDRQRVEGSIRYLGEEVPHLRTPLSLCWAILGLAAWGERPAETEAFLSQCLDRRDFYGAYNTHQLCLLLAAMHGVRGFSSLFEDKGEGDA